MVARVTDRASSRMSIRWVEGKSYGFEVVGDEVKKNLFLGDSVTF
jgi:hypothetical protein